VRKITAIIDGIMNLYTCNNFLNAQPTLFTLNITYMYYNFKQECPYVTKHARIVVHK